MPLFGCPVRQGRTLRANGGSSLKGLFKIRNNVINVLRTDRNTDTILCRARVKTLLFGELLVGRRPWVDRKGLGISNTI